jgi:ATP-dependent exoDNAse (exonuclease V) alpha subunit
VVVSQSWSEIHKVNEQVRLGLKAQKLIGENETVVTALERSDLTDAQKRDKRFYQPDSLLLFNRPTVGFKSGSTGKLRGVTDKHLLIEADNRIRPVPFKDLERITVCQPKELSLSAGDRLQLKANAQSQDGRKIANGELVTVKEIHDDGRIALDDGRVLAKNYRQFVRGYAVTSYAAQGKTVDYVLFSDSAVKAATNEQQWYVTISRGRKGVKVFTADKIQLRQNIAHSGDRPLALDMARKSSVHKLAQIWGRDVAYVLNVQLVQRTSAERQAEALRQDETVKQAQAEQQTEAVKPTEPNTIPKPQTIRRRIEIPPPQPTKSRGMRV